MTQVEKKRLADWKKLIKRFQKAMDVTVTGYDPSLSFYDNYEKPYLVNCQIPRWLAERILERISEGRPIPTKRDKNGCYLR